MAYALPTAAIYFAVATFATAATPLMALCMISRHPAARAAKRLAGSRVPQAEPLSTRAIFAGRAALA